MQFNRVNNKEHLRSPGGQRCRHICACTGGVPLHFIVWQLIAQAVLLPPHFPPSFHCFYSVTGACSCCCVGAYGWVARICQPWEQSSSRSWLPIVEVHGCFRRPTLILAMQLLTTESRWEGWVPEDMQELPPQAARSWMETTPIAGTARKRWRYTSHQ